MGPEATDFTPLRSLIGGAMIGLAAVWLMAANGRIAGISGILSSLFSQKDGRAWRLAFLAGLLGAPTLYVLVRG